MDSSRDFEIVYDQELKPALDELELVRKKVIRSGLFTVLPALAAAGGLLYYFKSDQILPVWIYGCSLALIVVAVWFGIQCYYSSKQYRTAFKTKVISALINAVDKTLTYEAFNSVSEADYKKSRLYLKSYDRFKGDDLISGMKDKTVFCFSEIHTEYEVRRGKNTYWETIFKGLFFIADFNKDFSGRTYVWSEYSPQLNLINGFFSSFDDDLEKISLEGTEFESRFVVYSSDQVEARYILTPSMMERMVKLQDKFNENVTFSFVDTNVYAAVPFTLDLFEPSLFSETGKYKLKGYYDAILHMLEIVDDLELNVRIWTKG